MKCLRLLISKTTTKENRPEDLISETAGYGNSTNKLIS